MKDLGELKRILGMIVKRDGEKSLSIISEKSYVLNVLKKYNMPSCKAVLTPLAPHFLLSSLHCPVIEQEMLEISSIP